MNIKKITIIAMLMVFVLSGAVNVIAGTISETGYLPYTNLSTSGEWYGFQTSFSGTVSMNTRPTSGKNGVIVDVCDTNKTVLMGKTFPYYVSISPLEYNTKNFPTVKYIHIYAGGENATGQLAITRTIEQ